MKLDLQERRLRGLGVNKVVGHRQLSKMVSSFISGLEETKEIKS